MKGTVVQLQMLGGGLRAHSGVVMVGREEAEAFPSLPCVVLLCPPTATAAMLFPTKTRESKLVVRLLGAQKPERSDSM
jgi:hypothetical protein